MKAFLAVSVDPGAPSPELGQPHSGAIGILSRGRAADIHRSANGWLALVDPDPDDMVDGAPSRFTVRLGRAVRTRSGDVSTAEVGSMLRDGRTVDTGRLTDLLPPFAAAHCGGPGQPIVLAGDWLGFHQLFWWQGDGVAAVSTSALALASLAGAEPDLPAIGLQSLIGAQIGERTVFRGVTKLAAGCVAVLDAGKVTVHRYIDAKLPLDDAPPTSGVMAEMAEILVEFETAYLTDHPDAVVQLTGGHDSRIVLGAVPPAMRRGLRALTLDTHGGADAAIAARLSADWGLDHQVHWLDDQPPIDPATAHRLAVDAAVALDCMASPLALAPLALAESHLEQGHRLSGLGGEVARGFYYGGQPGGAQTSSRLVDRLAHWRLFANEAVEDGVLDADYVTQAHDDALGLLRQLFEGYSREWLRATDEFYLWQRTGRWGGAHGTVAATSRFFINPMFDRRFLTLGLAVDPADKRSSRLLAQLMCHLDQKLAAVPLDSGLPYARVAGTGPLSRAAVASLTARKAVRKVRQRFAGVRRPQLGAAEMAKLVVAHWRAEPDAAAALRRSGLVRESWLDELLTSAREAKPTTVAFLINLLVMSDLTSRPAMRENTSMETAS